MEQADLKIHKEDQQADNFGKEHKAAGWRRLNPQANETYGIVEE